MAATCALRSAVGISPLLQGQVCRSQQQAAVALYGRHMPAAQLTPPGAAFASSRRLLGGAALPSLQLKTPPKRSSSGRGGALASQAAYPAILGLGPDTLQWIFTVSASALMFRLLPPVSHGLLVPALFLNIPSRVVEAIKGEAGAWVAVAVLALRLFAQLPKYVDLPLAVLLSVLVAPYELLRFRGTQGAGIVSLAIGIFIAYSHVTANNGVDNTLRSDVLPTTFAIAMVLLIPAAFLLGVYV